MKKIFVPIAAIMLLTGLTLSQETGTTEINIIDVKLGKDVQERMIVEETATFDVGSKVYLWLKVVNGTDQMISIIWKQDYFAYKTELTIGGSPWRTWAFKTVHKAGDWTLTVTDSQDNILKEMSFTVR